MSAARAVPVIVGVGQVLQRLEDPREAAEPLEMMIQALERAEADAGAKLLQRADGVSVVRGMWGYGDPGREIGRRLGAGTVETVGTPYGGNYAHACVLDAARSVQAGRRGVVLVAAAENGRSTGQAQRRGIALAQSEAPGEPDRSLAEDNPIFHDAELARGMNSASDVFAVIGSALRAARGESLDANARRLAELWAGLSAVAGDNPHAWIREPRTAAEIGTAGPDNPMISSPYTRTMNANSRVDMAAAVIVCSRELARALGVPDAKLVHLQAAAEANDSDFLTERAELHRAPALALAGSRALELAGVTAERVEHLDLYSCFPSSVEVGLQELGLSADRPLSVTGGLTFGGGPLNSYSLHAVARTAEVVRGEPGSRGLVSSSGGWMAKHAVAIYSTEPAAEGFRHERLREPADAPRRQGLVDWEGPVVVEGYTVAHRAGAPRRAHAACLTEDGRRTWATVEDPAVLEAMLREEFCGRSGRVDGHGGLRLGEGEANA